MCNFYFWLNFFPLENASSPKLEFSPWNNILVGSNTGKKGSYPFLFVSVPWTWIHTVSLTIQRVLYPWCGTWQHNTIEFKVRLNGSFPYRNRSKNYSPLWKVFNGESWQGQKTHLRGQYQTFVSHAQAHLVTRILSSLYFFVKGSYNINSRLYRVCLSPAGTVSFWVDN